MFRIRFFSAKSADFRKIPAQPAFLAAFAEGGVCGTVPEFVFEPACSSSPQHQRNLLLFHVFRSAKFLAG
jgi:hypothetical protein